MRPRRGLTIVELLVVIGIIIILMGLGLLAYSHLERATTAKVTRAHLQIAQSLLDEYNSGPGLSQLGMGGSFQMDQYFPYKGGCYFTPKSPKPIGLDSEPMVAAGYVGVASRQGGDRDPSPQNDTGGYSYGTNGLPDSPRVPQNAVFNTACVMMYLDRIPTIDQNLAKLPSKALFVDSGGKAITLFTGGVRQAPAPILVDGWNNPIIFVPAGGLVTKINTGQLDANKKPLRVEILVRSSGVIGSAANPYTKGSEPPLKGNDRPFWASSGPDADFSLGDDNIYSFEH